ncbi:YndM family protein [Mesobacillus foraminis]|uniref:YndM family protein n=1 Tax=Mesobacillus foraminis TaxID=279826 RepID=UPI000EF4CEB6|nr:YndM family protein [Mesobacillus foraminis]
MRHLTAMAIKFISSLVLLYVILGLFFGMSFTNVFLITLALGIISYILGDMMILPRTSNTVATLADFGLAFLLIWIMSQNLTYGDNTFWPSLIAALGVTLFEYFFHKYINKNVVNAASNGQQGGNLQYQTEASEELAPVKPDVRSTNEDKNNQ